MSTNKQHEETASKTDKAAVGAKPSPYEFAADGSVVIRGGEAPPETSDVEIPSLVFASADSRVLLYQAECVSMLEVLHAQRGTCFDVIFADPPYFLSNGGMTCHGGRMAKVDKGDWDKSRGFEVNHDFTREWLERCQRVLKPNGTIWVTGTQHIIFSAGVAMQQLGYKILNLITWEKPNPPPNLSCRYFTHSTETVLWAAKNARSRHVFNYKLMREMNCGKQMKSVWRISAPGKAEKGFGRHPAQKPVALVERCLMASANPGAAVLDPFVGIGTTAVVAARLGMSCVGIDSERKWLAAAGERVQEELSRAKSESGLLKLE